MGQYICLIDVNKGLRSNIISRHQVQLNSVKGEKVNFFPLPLDQIQKTKKKKKNLPLDSLAPSVYNTLFLGTSVYNTLDIAF